MITIKNVRTLDGKIKNYEIPSPNDYTIEAKEKLLLLPGIVDPHICFGSIDNQNWNLAVESAIKAGIITVIELPDQVLPQDNRKAQELKNKRIAKGLLDLQIPLNYSSYSLYSRSNLEEIDQIGKEKQFIKGIVIHLDYEKRDYLDHNWESLFRLAAQEDIPIVINLGNEKLKQGPMAKEGEILLEKAIDYVEKWSNRLYVLNVSTQKEINLLQTARNRFLLVYAETTPEHLFPEDLSEANHLWDALNSNMIETIGSGYNVNRQSQSRVLYKGENYSLLDPMFFLPFLLNAVNEEKISMDKLVSLTSLNIHDIFELNRTHDFVLVDLEQEQTIQRLHSGQAVNIQLKGWPLYTMTKGCLFSSLNGRLSGDLP